MDEDGLPIVGSGIDLTKVSLTSQYRLHHMMHESSCVCALVYECL